MIVLGFDTATPATAVGLRLADGRVLEGRDDPAAGERPGHSTRLLPLARGLLSEANVGWQDIDRIAVGVGPGTFTGLRIGVASARGLAQSLGVDLVGVSSLRALARGAREDHDLVLAAIDARRGEVFLAAYSGEDEPIEPRTLAPEHLAKALEPLEDPLGDWVALGDGARRFERELRALGVTVPDAGSPLHRVRGSAVCELAAQSSTACAGVLPSYCRAPDAEASLQETVS